MEFNKVTPEIIEQLKAIAHRQSVCQAAKSTKTTLMTK